MANISESTTWSSVYRLETSDEVLGGDGGKANQQAVDLVARTGYLKNIIENAQASGANLNTVVTGGTYFVSGSTTNAPTANTHFLVVQKNGTNVAQRAFDITSGYTWTRKSTDTGSNWSTWKRLADTSDLDNLQNQIDNIDTELDSNLDPLVFGVTTISNLNTAILPNWYYYDIASTGAPNSGTDGWVQVGKSGNNLIQRVEEIQAIDGGSNSVTIYLRYSTDNGSNWTAWASNSAS